MGEGIIPGFYPQPDPPARGALRHPCHGQREQCRFREHLGSLGGLMRLWWCRWWWRVSRGGEGFVFPLLIWVLRADIRLWILHFVQLRVSIPILTGTTFAHCLALITTDLVGNLFFFSIWRVWQTCSGLFASAEGIFICREKINNNKKIVSEHMF